MKLYVLSFVNHHVGVRVEGSSLVVCETGVGGKMHECVNGGEGGQVSG